ncbi:MAG: DegT/DnrJ/EryC1/StrS aminotransferase family protein [Pseudomonadota bacterium]
MNFIDLAAQQDALRPEIEAGIAAVLAHGQYILGPEVREFEAKLAEFGQARHALGCANGTDALILPLMVWGVGPGDAVFVPSFTYCATAECVALQGATPVFVDVDRETYNMSAASLRAAIEGVVAAGELTPRAVIAVDIFGQSADYPAIAPIAKAFGLKLIADSAQGFGTTLDGRHPVSWADVATTSFFPAKPLGCYGDGGAMLTDDADLAGALDSARVHGKGADKYDNIRIGLNSRLDTLQAAILLPKLAVFGNEIEARNRLAGRYRDGLAQTAVRRLPTVMDGVVSTWAQYTIEVDDPVAMGAALKTQGIPTARYYPRPIHQQSAYAHYPVGAGGMANTEDCTPHIISLPMSPYLTEADQDRVIDAVREHA